MNEPDLSLRVRAIGTANAGWGALRVVSPHRILFCVILGVAVISPLRKSGIAHSQVLSVSGALTRDLDAKAKENALSLLDYCSDNTGATDCSAGIAEWFAEAVALNKALYIPAGIYRVSSQLLWYLPATRNSNFDNQYENVTGINVFGDGRYTSWIKFDANVASPNWQIYGPNTANHNFEMFSRFENFMVTGSTSGELMTWGWT